MRVLSSLRALPSFLLYQNKASHSGVQPLRSFFFFFFYASVQAAFWPASLALTFSSEIVFRRDLLGKTGFEEPGALLSRLGYGRKG